jgi:hypothetical protein
MRVQLRPGTAASAHTVVLGDLKILFSYETPVAFCVNCAGCCCSENVWSDTTGKHMTQETPVAPKDRTPNDEFNRRLDAILSHLQFVNVARVP